METQKINNRFRVATENLTEVSLTLLGKNLEELDPCVSELEEGSKILIDHEKGTFYFLDQQCLEEANRIIAHKFNTVCIPVDLEEIKNWS